MGSVWAVPASDCPRLAAAVTGIWKTKGERKRYFTTFQRPRWDQKSCIDFVIVQIRGGGGGGHASAINMPVSGTQQTTQCVVNLLLSRHQIVKTWIT